MFTVNALEALCGEVAESRTCTVKEYCPEAVGVPLITPVEALSDNPAGNPLEATLQL